VVVIVAIIYYSRKKKAESNFIITGCLDGTSPNPMNGICDRRWDWNQVPVGVFSSFDGMSEADWFRLKKFATGNQGLKLLEDNSFAGPFTETKRGLNVEDYAMGQQGLSLLEDGSFERNNSSFARTYRMKNIRA
jgi:hypothetical protein